MKKVLIIILTLIFLLSLLVSCGGGMSGGGGGANWSSEPQAAPLTDAYDYVVYEHAESEVFMSRDSSMGNTATVQSERKVITSANYQIRTDDFEGAMRSLEHQITVSGSFVENSSSYAATERHGAHASMTIRVPVNAYGSFKAFITELGELISSGEWGEDVTAQYFDTEARLTVLRAQQERIQSFIREARNIEEIFIIERELTRINTEIEQLTTVRNRLDNLTSFATVYVSISEDVPGHLDPANFSERASNAISGSVDVLIIAVQSILLLIIWCWPFLLIGAGVVVVWRKYRRRMKERKEQKND